MELRQLRYFLVLAEELHFAHAAEKLRIAQPSLSIQIQSLEATLGTKLFARTKRAVELTSAGKLFLEEARLTVAQADRAVTIGRRAGRGEIGTLRIAVASGSSLSGVPSTIMTQYRKRYPEIDLQVALMPTNRQVECLRANTLDIGFLVLPAIIGDDLGRIKLSSDNAVIALSEDNPLACKEALLAAELRDEHFLVLNPKASAGVQESTYMLGQQGGFTPNIVGSENEVLALLSLVSAGMGVVVLAHSACRIHMPKVVYRHVTDFSFAIELNAVFRRDDTAKPTREFLTACRNYAESH